MISDPEALLRRLEQTAGRSGRLTHVEVFPARAGRTGTWPDWVHPDVLGSLAAAGIVAPWRHQVEAAEMAHRGRHVIVSTGTSSGKSLAYLLPALSRISAERPGRAGPSGRLGRGATVLYLAPTKALARDQLRGLHELCVPNLRLAAVDGDASLEERDWARDNADYIVSNPDLLHRSLLPTHARWAQFLGSLSFVVVDEAHHYRGVFGAHVAQVLRRLRRLCRHYGSDPTFVLASATAAEPDRFASRLVGSPVAAVSDDAAPRGTMVLGLWEPPLSPLRGENNAPVRRTATAETADLLADLVAGGVRTLAFVRSRRGAETVALTAGRLLADVEPGLADRVAAYRGGYLPEDRRVIEEALSSGELLGLAATNALELGIDVVGLEAVLIAGFPGTRAAIWQQAGRAGRGGTASVALLVARDDPLDTYLVRNPQALIGAPVEATVFDPDNPFVLGPHLCAAAQELSLSSQDLAMFGPAAEQVVAELVSAGLLRARPHGWFWTRRGRAGDLADIRSTGGGPVQLVEADTGRLIGTVDASSAHTTVHPGAVYLHQGVTHLVDSLDLTEGVAMLHRANPDYTTIARETTSIDVESRERVEQWGEGEVNLGTVEVTSQVVGFLRRRLLTGEVLGEEPLDLPERTLRTKAVWWTLSPSQVAASGVGGAELPGAAHAAEHASIGLLPLFATCDRWDIGGVSTALHPDTGRLTVFVYDGHPGGAGFAERGFRAASRWLSTTRAAIESCECEDGCPSCVQSPKCGNGNSPLDKAGAITLLDVLLREAPALAA